MIYFSVRTLQPRSFTKIAYNETLFEVSWLPPKDDARVNNYTVFWCLSENHRDRPYQVQYKNIFVKLKFRVLIEIPYVQLLKLVQGAYEKFSLIELDIYAFYSLVPDIKC